MRLSDIVWIYKNYTLSDFYNIAASRTMYGIENFHRSFFYKRKVKNELRYEDIEIAIEKGRTWLENHQRADGSIGRIEQRQWEIWDTANAALALIETGGNRDCIDKAVNFVLDGRLENGSFYMDYVPKALKENLCCICIESTSVALLAAYKKKNIAEEVKRGIDVLIKEQNEDGSWELRYLPGVSKYPSVTGFALKTLLYIKICPEKTLQKALSFLETTQQRNGSWGRASEYYNTESYAIKNISDALILARSEEWLSREEKDRIDMMLQRCTSCVINRQNPDGSWSAIGPSSTCVSTALYLQVLLNVRAKVEKNDMDLIPDAARFLIERQQKNGFWYGGKLVKYNCDFFATSEVLIALSKLAELYPVQ